MIHRSFSKITVLATMFALIYAGVGTAQTTQREIDNALGQAYSYLSEKQTDKAKEQFTVAGNLAQEAKAWEPLVEAAQGLIVCKDFQTARELLRSAYDFLEDTNDYQAHLALAYGMLGIPPEQRHSLFPVMSVKKAYNLALNTEDWYALTESAKLFFILDENKTALDALAAAGVIVKNRKDPQGALRIAEMYKKNHYPDFAQEYKQLAQEYKEEQKPEPPPPPPGWSAAGDTVAGPPPVDVEAGRAIRAGADQQIADKRAYMLEKERIDAQQRQTYYNYHYLYSYPFDYPYSGYYIYDYDDDDLFDWCDDRLSHYHYVDGYYIRIDD